MAVRSLANRRLTATVNRSHYLVADRTGFARSAVPGGEKMTRHTKILFFSAIFGAVATAVMPVTALAQTNTYSDSVTGVEAYATSTEGVLTGSESEATPGTWTPDLLHRHSSATPRT